MDGKIFIALVISIVSLISGGLAWLNWLSYQNHTHQMDIALQLSQEATRRQEIVARNCR
ncbi:hypothetical protein [Methylomicrobium sp. Wu6]|uniref:hypothetical protein n=1 Tax=Methylomicrobium sp. Wu6 TaxID=3107928 RepID=UPI002DD64AFA|nr:hypothetical protein [Methylomicrobium sp. Wu6]MEC4750041.1 hypothetical protein [Methylomicrobium sp. Wu6]